MVNTIRDLNIYFDYSKLVSTEIVDGKVANLIGCDNYIENTDKYNFNQFKPRIIKFGHIIAIAGDKYDVLFGSAYIKNHPNEKYVMDLFEDPSVVVSRFKAVYGFELDEYDDTGFITESYRKIDTSLTGGMSDERRYNELAELRTVSNAQLSIFKAISEYHPSDNKAILLIGHSGIAKSAVVKASIEALSEGITPPVYGDDESLITNNKVWGYRLIDIRAGYLDRSDLLGFVTLESDNKGGQVWTDAPNKELLSCSTEFVLETRKYLISNKITPENTQLFERLYELAQTPVIFFDEINRGNTAIINQIMVIVNQHRLNSYNVDIAPIIAAANLPIGIEKLSEDKKALFEYLVTDIYDRAVIDRFIPLLISGDDISVIGSAYKFLSKEFEDSPLSLKVLAQAKKNGNLYNFNVIDEKGKFATFRGWEYLCKYLRYCEKSGAKPLDTIVKGLIGANTPISLLTDQDKSTDMFIDHAMKAGITILLTGRMGVGKTAKLLAACKNNNGELLPIDLSAQDRTTVNGYPSVQKLSSYMVGEELSKSPGFMEWNQQLVNNPKVPLQTTVFMPNKDLAQKVEDCKISGRKLVILFDEANRGTATTQGAIFQCISDETLFGVSLKGVNYSVVAAGNVGDEYQVEKLDTATIHRFATLDISKINQTDFQDWQQYLKKELPFAYEFINTMGADRVLEMLNTDIVDEDASIATPFLSMRSFKSLENVFNRHDYTMLSKFVDIYNLKEVVETISQSNYIMRTVDPNSEISFDEPPLIKLYGKSVLPVLEYLPQTITLLQDDSISNEDKDLIISVLQTLDSNRQELIYSELKAIIPSIFLPDFKQALVKKYHEKSSVSVSIDFSSENTLDIEKTIRLLFSNPTTIYEDISVVIMNTVKNNNSIKASHLINILDRFQSIVGTPLPLNYLLELQFYDHKIQKDKLLYTKFDLSELRNHTIEIFDPSNNSEYEIKSEDYNLVDICSLLVEKKIDVTADLSISVIELGEKRVLDFYRLVGSGGTVMFDSDIWKCDTGNTSYLSYKTDFLIWQFEVSTKIIVSDKDLKFKIDKNLSLVKEALEIAVLYDVELKDIPTDVIDMTVIKNIDISTSSIKGAERLLSLDVAESILLRKFWKNFELGFV